MRAVATRALRESGEDRAGEEKQPRRFTGTLPAGSGKERGALAQAGPDRSFSKQTLYALPAYSPQAGISWKPLLR